VVGSSQNWKRVRLGVNIALGCGVILCVLRMLCPIEIRVPAPSRSLSSGGNMETASRGVRPISEYAAIWKHELRRPLYDPEVKPVIAAPPPKPSLTVQLVGTVIEEGFTYAILQGKGGKTEFVSVGQSLDGAEVTGIEKDCVHLKFCGDVVTLKAKRGSQ
jgi:hypothetical protein